MEGKQVETIKFTLDDIKQLSKEVSKNTIIPFDDLPEYDLFLSQVIDYLNDRFEGEKFTNNIVQNYVKNEVITKPEDGKKRGYTKAHLTELVLLGYMRPILTTDEIKKVFRLAFNEINDRSDDIISWQDAYKIFTDVQKDSFDEFFERKLFDESKLEKLVDDYKLDDKNKSRISVFLVVLTLMAQASAIKKLARKIVDEFEE
jgi:hypothetical protein